MKYTHTVHGIFLNRPNRFIAICLVNGVQEACHVKNTGRCRELLLPGASVILEPSQNSNRKTKYSLIAVYKKDMLINLDSQAPNQLVWEWIQEKNLFSNLSLLKREVSYGSSRFDLYAEYDSNKAFIEVKGCTLEENGIAIFPDAKTARGVKHVKELESCVNAGFQAFLIIVIQMQPVRFFCPNYRTHPEFGEALFHASQHGVHILAYDCKITAPSSTDDSMELTIHHSVPIHLTPDVSCKFFVSS